MKNEHFGYERLHHCTVQTTK